MKKTIYMILAWVVLLTACSAPATSGAETTEYVPIPYVSSITASECFVCSESGQLPDGLHWGQDNVGILNLNTFEVLGLEINRYRWGERTQEPAGVMFRDGIICGESSAHAFVDPDRGFALVQIEGRREPINAAVIQGHLCQKCLDGINETCCGDDPPEAYAVINFSDRSIRPLVRQTPFFTSKNFGVEWEYRSNGDIDLLVFCCPPRYK